MKIYLTIVFLISAQFLFAQKIEVKDLVLYSQKTIKYKKGNGKLIVDLWNKSNDTLFYKSMSCSWQNFYFFDNPNIHVLPANCDKNIPVILVLPPSEKHRVELNIKIDKKFTQDFKVGLNIRQSKTNTFLDNESLIEKNEVLWSSTIYLR